MNLLPEAMIRRCKPRLFRRACPYTAVLFALSTFVFSGLLIYRNLAISDELDPGIAFHDDRSEVSFAYQQPETCEVIHVMSVVGGHNATFGFSVLLKSLLSIRRNPLVLHLLVDENSKTVLEEMLSSWMISGLTYKFYDIQKVAHLVSWVPNIHYSGTFGLLKLIVPYILSDIDKVIVLDTDLLFMDDILPMWNAFVWLRASGSVFGLVENQSDWYMKTVTTTAIPDNSDDVTSTNKDLKGFRQPWPALGRGFNTGLILMDLFNLRKSGTDWMDLWKTVATRHLETFKFTTLADQDIFNAVFAENPSLVFKLPCDWNFQLSYGSKEDHCLTNLTTIFRVLHFNHPEKTALLFEYGDGDMDGLFANVYARAVETNGYYFRSMFTSCTNAKEVSNPAALKYGHALDDLSPADACYEIRLETVTMRRIFPFFFSGRTTKINNDAKHSISIVTHLGFERISQLELVCRNWNAAISAAVYLSDADLIPLIRLLLDDSSCLSSGNVHLHLVFRYATTYPVNMLRNVALRFASTSHVLILDADFVPSPKLDSTFLEEFAGASSDRSILTTGRTAVVVPAFDVSSFVDLSLIRDGSIDKRALLDLVDRGLAQPFQSVKWPAGHGPTNFTAWRTASAPYKVEWAPDYEPYVLMRLNKSTPRFDERFVGFGWNKVSYAMQLDAMVYSFVVHPSMFVLHLPHLPSLDLLRFRSNTLYQTCLENFKLEFVNELASKHGATALKYLKIMPSSNRASVNDNNNIHL